MVARTKVARTRLTPSENEAFEERARQAGISPSEFLRRLILEEQEMGPRLARIEQRLEHLEEQVAQMWLKEGRHGDQIS